MSHLCENRIVAASDLQCPMRVERRFSHGLTALAAMRLIRDAVSLGVSFACDGLDL